jgi:hypothetical protein
MSMSKTDVNSAPLEIQKELETIKLAHAPRWLRLDEQPDLDHAGRFLTLLDPAAGQFLFLALDNRHGGSPRQIYDTFLMRPRSSRN